MEEYKYAVVSGGIHSKLYGKNYTGSNERTIYYTPNETFFTPPGYDYTYKTLSEFMFGSLDSKYPYPFVFSPKSFNGETSYDNKDFIIKVLLEDDNNIAVRYYVPLSITGDLIIDRYSLGVTNDDKYCYYDKYVSSLTIATDITFNAFLYIDFYYPGNSNTYKKYTTTTDSNYVYSDIGGAAMCTITFYISITRYSIQNLNGIDITDRILNTLYT